MLFNRSQSRWTDADANPPLHDGWDLAPLSSTDEMVPLIETVASAMAGEGYPQKDVFAVWLALEGHLANSFHYGHNNDRISQVMVRYRVDAQYVLVEVEGPGSGFDPLQVPEPIAPAILDQPSGHGLRLIRSYSRWMCYNDQGNTVF
jgi:serine/threonine-protein kinase RsbW